LRILLNYPKIWGDPVRLSIHPTAQVNDALFNTVSGEIVIRENVFFGHSVMVVTGTHDYTQIGHARKSAFPVAGRNIVIERGTWIGSGAIIIGPCSIGMDSVVAAGCVVVAGSTFPERSFIAGIPGKLIRSI
jgi:acetyltransferase-like isoleucine patch superfamily enzyme